MKLFVRFRYLFILAGCMAFFGYNSWLIQQSVHEKTDLLNQLADSIDYKNPLLAIDAKNNPKGAELVKEKAFIESQLKLSAHDSIGLVIHVPDSLIELQIKGVTIFRSKISKMEISNALYALSLPAYYKLFAVPLTIREQISSVVKEPIIVKKAPKDTIEAAQAEIIPDSIIHQSADLKFLVDGDILLQITHPEKENNKFLLKMVNQTIYFLRFALKFEKPNYQPTIKLTIPNEDIIVIYRALPWNAHFAVKL